MKYLPVLFHSPLYRSLHNSCFENFYMSTDLNCESLIINYSIGSDIHVYTDVMPIMKFKFLVLSFEVHLCIALKQRKIADFEVIVNYFFLLIAACMVDYSGRHFSFYAKRTPRQGNAIKLRKRKIVTGIRKDPVTIFMSKM